MLRAWHDLCISESGRAHFHTGRRLACTEAPARDLGAEALRLSAGRGRPPPVGTTPSEARIGTERGVSSMTKLRSFWRAGALTVSAVFALAALAAPATGKPPAGGSSGWSAQAAISAVNQ